MDPIVEKKSNIVIPETQFVKCENEKSNVHSDTIGMDERDDEFSKSKTPKLPKRKSDEQLKDDGKRSKGDYSPLKCIHIESATESKPSIGLFGREKNPKYSNVEETDSPDYLEKPSRRKKLKSKNVTQESHTSTFSNYLSDEKTETEHVHSPLLSDAHRKRLGSNRNPKANATRDELSLH